MKLATTIAQTVVRTLGPIQIGLWRTTRCWFRSEWSCWRCWLGLRAGEGLALGFGQRMLGGSMARSTDGCYGLAAAHDTR